MTTAIRKHGKAADINPADYRHLGDYYNGPSPHWREVYGLEHSRLAAVLNVYGQELNPATKCEHCGAGFNHGSLYLYEPTSEIISVGQICSVNTFRNRAKTDLAQARLKRAYDRAVAKEQTEAAREAWIAENSEVHAHLVKFADDVPFYRDLLGSLSHYGGLTARQTEAVKRNIQRDSERAVRNLTREAENAEKIAAGVKAPTGVTNVVGTVLSVRTHENAYGYRLVMTVEDDRGFKVWGTVPRSLNNPTSGDRVTFLAEVTPSDTDPLFGFFKRPRKAGFLQATNL